MEGVIPKLLNFLGKLRSYFTGAASNGRFKDGSEGVRRPVHGIGNPKFWCVCLCAFNCVHCSLSHDSYFYLCTNVKSKKKNYTKSPYSPFPSILWDFTFGG